MDLNAVMFANKYRTHGSVVLIEVWAKIFKNRSLILRFHHPYLVLEIKNLFFTDLQQLLLKSVGVRAFGS